MPYHVTKPPTSSLAGTTANGAAAVTGLGSTAALYVGQPVAGPGIPAGAMVATIDSPTQVTLSAPATATGTVTLGFGVEPVTLAEAKQHLQITFSDDDDKIRGLITFAREDREARLERSFLTTGWELILDGFPCSAGYGYIPLSGYIPYSLERDWNAGGAVLLRRPPIQSVGNITYIDTTGIEQTLTLGVDFTVRTLGVKTAPTKIYPMTRKRWPTTLAEPDVVRIAFTAGYGDTADVVPACIKESMLMLIDAKYKGRSAETETANNAGEVPISIDRVCASEDWGARA